ncbi:MAG: hypothetical protein KDB80_00310 [Planctomycetes bacterium]|nr:hypothetical protein [Planctomycetota bacterium]
MNRTDVFLTIACLTLAAGVAIQVCGVPADDAWITLRYARNLLAGHGWCYEPGVAVNASTSAASTLVHAAAGALAGDLRVAQFVVFVLGLGGTAALLGLEFGARGSLGRRLPGLVAAAFVLTTPMFWTVYGMESPLLLLGCVGSWVAWRHERFGLAAAAAAFLVLVRPEGVLMPVALVVDRALRRRDLHALPWRRIVIVFSLPLIAWAVFSWLEFGALAPSTLAAKQAQAQSLWQWSLFFRGAKRSLTMFDAREIGLHHRVFVGLLLTSVVALVVTRHRALALLGWIALVNVGYVVLVVPYYHWYAVPLHFGLTVAMASVFDLAWRAGRSVRAFAIVCGVAWVALQMPAWGDRGQGHAGYWDVGAWLDAHAAADATIGSVEIGCVGYAVWPRPIVDACGLVTTDLIPDVAAGECARWIERHRPDYVVLHVPPWDGFESAAEASPTFAEYREVYRARNGTVRVVSRVP